MGRDVREALENVMFGLNAAGEPESDAQTP